MKPAYEDTLLERVKLNNITYDVFSLNKIIAKDIDISPSIHFRTGSIDRASFSSIHSKGIDGGYRTIPDGHSSKNDVLVSIITVCRNAEATIQSAIDSVREQSHPNVEHIIIDGNSTDGTLNILRSNERWLSYFLSEPDDGIYSAMNKGLLLAKGEFIAILNADDRLYPAFIEESLAALRATGADISYCNYDNESTAIQCPPISVGILFSQLSIKHNTFLFSRDAFHKVGGFDEGYKIVSDAKWNRLAFLRGLRFVKVDKSLIFYSARGASAAHTNDQKSLIINESSRLIRELFPFLDDEEASSIYLSNFNNHRLSKISEIFNSKGTSSLLRAALQKFIEFNLSHRESYEVEVHTAPERLVQTLVACFNLSISFDQLKFRGNDAGLSAAFRDLTQIYHKCNKIKKPVVLHFVRTFSSPSETFIYNFINDARRAQRDEFIHVVLCDRRDLEKERPIDDILSIDWDVVPHVIREYVYRHIFSSLIPQRIVNHFALNGFHLWKRLTALERQIPTINMCHGIDVFVIDEDEEYSAYVREYCSISPRVCFTTVSHYLRDVLLSRGVPAEKIFQVPNSISSLFYEHRKRTDFYDGLRELKILAVGRLIAWKGHNLLIEALGELHRKQNFKFSLTIACGGYENERRKLEQLAAENGIFDFVRFVSFIDFQKQPQFYAHFDLFVQPSTYSNDKIPRTETFGVSVLEAMTAGLPVIVSDAGGIPEVAGGSNSHVRIVPAGNIRELSAAIYDMVKERQTVFADASELAKGKLDAFSSMEQLKKFKEAELWCDRKLMKVVQFSALTTGGAAGASLNIHKALMESNINSFFVTRSDKIITPFMPNVQYIEPEFNVGFDTYQGGDNQKRNFTLFSIDDEVLSNDTVISYARDADIIILGWHARFLSSGNVGALCNLGVPVFITIRDMNPITGGCHYFHGCHRWKSNCTSCPQLKNNDDDFPMYVFENKLGLWESENKAFIALSKHSEDILRESPLVGNAPVFNINNIVDTNVFFPENKSECRSVFGFDDRSYTIGYLPSFGSSVKGHEQCVEALKALKVLVGPEARIEVGLAGVGRMDKKAVRFRIKEFGHLHRKDELRKFYSAVDVIVVPSLEETFSNTVVESLACGTPVVGFRTGILAELGSDEKLASAVPIGDSVALARAIFQRMGCEQDRAYCHEYIKREFGRDAIITKYRSAFKHMQKSDGEQHSVKVVAASRGGLSTLDFRRKVRRRAVDGRRSNRTSQRHGRSANNITAADALAQVGEPSSVFFLLRAGARCLFPAGVPEWGKVLGRKYLLIEGRMRDGIRKVRS